MLTVEKPHFAHVISFRIWNKKIHLIRFNQSVASWMEFTSLSCPYMEVVYHGADLNSHVTHYNMSGANWKYTTVADCPLKSADVDSAHLVCIGF